MSRTNDIQRVPIVPLDVELVLGASAEATKLTGVVIARWSNTVTMEEALDVWSDAFKRVLVETSTMFTQGLKQ